MRALVWLAATLIAHLGLAAETMPEPCDAPPPPVMVIEKPQDPVVRAVETTGVSPAPRARTDAEQKELDAAAREKPDLHLLDLRYPMYVDSRADENRAWEWNAALDSSSVTIDRPLGKSWISVGEAMLYARQIWGVAIYDQSGDPAIQATKFRLDLGPVDGEMAMPLFMEALTRAVEFHAHAYLDFYPQVGVHGFDSQQRGAYYIRKAYP
jgi:hypothetical protein